MIPGIFISSRAEHDLTLQYRWYLENADEDIAERYLHAVDETIRLVAERPDLGRLRRFAAPELHGIRSLQVRRPFDSHLLFDSSGDGLRVERVMHGARDLPERLVEPPDPVWGWGPRISQITRIQSIDSGISAHPCSSVPIRGQKPNSRRLDHE